MKITKKYLRQVIKEELSAIMSEADAGYYQIGPPGPEPSPNKDAGEISDIEGKLADFYKRIELAKALKKIPWGHPAVDLGPQPGWTRAMLDAATQADSDPEELEAAIAKVNSILATGRRD